MSGWQAGMRIPNETNLVYNEHVYPSRREALESGRALLAVWTLPTEVVVTPTKKPVTHRFENGVPVALAP